MSKPRSRPGDKFQHIPLPILATRHSCPDIGPHVDAVYTIINGRLTCRRCLSAVQQTTIPAQLDGHRLKDHDGKQLIIWNMEHVIKNHDGIPIFKDCVVTFGFEELPAGKLPGTSFNIHFSNKMNPSADTPQYLVRHAHINRPDNPVGIDFWDANPIGELGIPHVSLFNVTLAKDEDVLAMMQHVREIRAWDSRGRAPEAVHDDMIQRVKDGEISYNAGAQQVAEALRIKPKSVKDTWRNRGFSRKNARQYEKRLNKI